MLLNEKLQHYQIILASSSPRRQQFLKDLGLPFETRLKPVKETYSRNLTPTEVVNYLAKLKTKPYEKDLEPHHILITGDTIVCQDGKILGKPETATEAFHMLDQLSGKYHEVISSICLKSPDKTILDYGRTKVYFRPLAREEIDFYIKTFQPFDKAGAYGIQEWIGKIGIEKIEGSFYNVMGMPIDKLYTALQNF